MKFEQKIFIDTVLKIITKKDTFDICTFVANDFQKNRFLRVVSIIVSGIARKYPLCGCILDVLTHTTALDLQSLSHCKKESTRLSVFG